MSDPGDDLFQAISDGVATHIVATGDEWCYLDGPDPRRAEGDWSAFDPQRSHLTPLTQVIAEIRDMGVSPDMADRQ